MYLFTATLKPAVGKSSEAVVWAKELGKFIGQHYPNGGVTGIYREVFSEEGTIVMTSELKTLADLEALIAWTATNEQYQAIFKRGQQAGIQADRLTWKLYQVM